MRRAVSIEIQKEEVQPNLPPPAADTYEAHAILAAGKLDVKGLGLNERAYLGTCQDIYRNNRGAATPFENFITTVIRWATWGNTPKPEDLIEEIKTETEEDFELTLHSVKRFVQNYPELIASFQEATPATSAPPVAPETTTRPTRQPAKARRARKTRKKAGHA